MKYAFIRAHLHEDRVSRLCQVLQVSRSGFYAWRHRQESARAQRNRHLVARMRVLHRQTREAYGVRKMRTLLAHEGLQQSARVRPCVNTLKQGEGLVGGQ